MMMTTKRSAEAGFTLIEVLVTVLIMAVGLLGLAGLQLTALQYNHSAYMRSQATMLANDIADRMRANAVAERAGAYDVGTAAVDTDCNNNATGCTTSELAGNDLFEWNAALASDLPAGEGVVCLDATPDDGTGPAAANHACDGGGEIYAIKIWWQDDRSGTKQSFVTTFKP